MTAERQPTKLDVARLRAAEQCSSDWKDFLYPTAWKSLSFLSSPFSAALMKLSRPANLQPKSIIRTIFLPSSSHVHVNPNIFSPSSFVDDNDDDKFDRNENYLRKVDTKKKVQNIVSLIAQVNEREVKKRQAATSKTQVRSSDMSKANSKKHRRRNDKFLHRRKPTIDDYLIHRVAPPPSSSSVDYIDCVAVGWGKYKTSGDLSDALLKIEVPIQNIKRWE